MANFSTLFHVLCSFVEVICVRWHYCVTAGVPELSQALES